MKNIFNTNDVNINFCTERKYVRNLSYHTGRQGELYGAKKGWSQKASEPDGDLPIYLQTAGGLKHPQGTGKHRAAHGDPSQPAHLPGCCLARTQLGKPAFYLG